MRVDNTIRHWQSSLLLHPSLAAAFQAGAPCAVIPSEKPGWCVHGSTFQPAPMGMATAQSSVLLECWLTGCTQAGNGVNPDLSSRAMQYSRWVQEKRRCLPSMGEAEGLSAPCEVKKAASTHLPTTGAAAAGKLLAWEIFPWDGILLTIHKHRQARHD